MRALRAVLCHPPKRARTGAMAVGAGLAVNCALADSTKRACTSTHLPSSGRAPPVDGPSRVPAWELRRADATARRARSEHPDMGRLIADGRGRPTAHIGGSARGYLPTHSRSWPLWPPLGYGQRKQADRIFMQWRPQGERPDLPLGARFVGLIRVSHPGWIVAGVKGARRRRCTLPRWLLECCSPLVWPGMRSWAGLCCQLAVVVFRTEVSCRTIVNSSNSGRCPGSAQPGGLRM